MTRLCIPHNNNEKIMEYGCGAGLLTTFFKPYGIDYYGLDYSATLVTKHIKLLNNCVFNLSSTETIFKTEYFDYVVINSMLEYLTSRDDLIKTMDEIERISKKGIYVANIRKKTRTVKHNKHKYDGEYSHFVIDESFFTNLHYTVLPSLYDEDRYDIYKTK